MRAAHKSRDTLELKVEAAQKELKDCLLKLEENQKTAEESKKYECLFCKNLFVVAEPQIVWRRRGMLKKN